MIITTKSLSLALAGITLAGLAATTGMANAPASAVQCGVATSTQGGMLAIEGTILSPIAMTGEYRFSIRSVSNGNSSNINQGGMFSAAANEVTTIGKVTVNAGASVDVDFNVTAGGQKFDCGQDAVTRL